MTSLTLADFVKTFEQPKKSSKFDIIPSDVYDTIMIKNLSRVDKMCVHLAFAQDAREITKKEMLEAELCDAENKSDDEWYEAYKPFDKYDESDFLAEWEEEDPDRDEYEIK